MHVFKQFMDVKQFTELTTAAMGTHRTKPEVVRIMRALALKYSDLGDHEKALSYIERSENLAVERLPTMEHTQVILTRLIKVDILLKKLRLGTEEDF